MKPREEEWTHKEGSALVSCGPGEEDSGVFYGRSHIAAARAQLASAAPDMARALLAVHRCEVHGPCRHCAAAVLSALTKAGVLP